MKALSLTRPWTELVIAGVKDVENRTWRTTHRGWLVIHGAKGYDPAALALVGGLGTDGMLTSEDYANLDSCSMHDSTADTGYLGVVRVVGCHKSGDLDCFAAGRDVARGKDLGACSPWGFSGHWHWMLAEPLRFAVPIPGRGMPGVFDVPPDVSDEIQRICPGILDG